LNNYMHQNLAVNISVKDNQRDDERRDRFTLEEINIILNGIKNKSPKFKYDWNYWIFLIALFTGCRITEICQLYAEEDIREIDGIWCFDINIDLSDKSDAIKKELKNKSSKRKIPIHPKLIELGFLNFVFERRKTNQTMLFNGITKMTDRNLGDKPGDYANDLIDSCGIVSDLKVFHSFRHTFKDMLKEAGVEEEFRDKLCGHENKSSSCLYYESQTSMEKLYPEICKIHFDYDFDSINFFKLKKNRIVRKMKK